MSHTQRILVLSGGLLLAFTFGAAMGQYDNLSQKMQIQRDAVYSQNLSLYAEPRGALAQGRSETRSVNLNPGHYGVTAFCDRNCDNLTVTIGGRSKRLDANGWASMEFDIGSYGNHDLRISMDRCYAEECHWGAVVFN